MKYVAFLLAFTIAAPAFAYDDEMMGTMINGRQEVRTERAVRVQDPEMDRELMLIDREKRARDGGKGGTIESDRVKRKPYEGPLPD